jgi:hypothetical protein
MGLKEAATEINKACEGIDGIEVNLDGESVDIYWHNLRLFVGPKDFPKAISTIKALVSLDATFE